MTDLLVKTLREATGLSVSLRHNTEKSDAYITYFEYLNQGEMFADDNEITTGRYYQIDIFCKYNYDKLVRKVEKALKEVGFMKRSQFDGPYEPDTGLYHKVLRYLKEE